MGKTIVHQGAAGAGQHTKMVNQILISSNMIGVCEALLYGYKAGLDLETVFKSVVGAARPAAWSLRTSARGSLPGNFEPGFFVEHFIKDMGIALAEAEKMNLSLAGPGPGQAALPSRQGARPRPQGHARADAGAGEIIERGVEIDFS